MSLQDFITALRATIRRNNKFKVWRLFASRSIVYVRSLDNGPTSCGLPLVASRASCMNLNHGGMIACQENA